MDSMATPYVVLVILIALLGGVLAQRLANRAKQRRDSRSVPDRRKGPRGQ